MGQDKVEKITQVQVIQDLLDAWRERYSAVNVIAIGDSNWGLLSDPEQRLSAPGDLAGNRADLILAEFAFIPKSAKVTFGGNEYRFMHSWVGLMPWLAAMSDGGHAIALVPSVAVTQNSLRDLHTALESQGLGVEAILRLPGSFEDTGTSVRPLLVVIGYQPGSTLFVADVSGTTDPHALIRAMADRAGSDTLEDGIIVESQSFRSIEGVLFAQRAAALSKRFDGYRWATLRELSEDDSAVGRGEIHRAKPNAVYISQIVSARVRVAVDPSELSGDHSHYRCIELGGSVLAEYVAFHLSTELGEASIRSLAQGATIQRVHPDDLLGIPIAVPPLTTQAIIVEANRVLKRLVGDVSALRAELDAHPVIAGELLSRGREMLAALGKLSDADSVREWIRRGESDTTEFKETFSWDVRQQKKADHIEFSSLKTIAAFMNTRGGVLLVGVADDQSVPGVGVEIERLYSEKGMDGLLLHIDNRMKKFFGEALNAMVQRCAVEIEGRPVVLFKCPRSTDPVFLNNEEFYVRKTPSSAKLTGTELAKYLMRHFQETQLP